MDGYSIVNESDELSEAEKARLADMYEKYYLFLCSDNITCDPEKWNMIEEAQSVLTKLGVEY